MELEDRKKFEDLKINEYPTEKLNRKEAATTVMLDVPMILNRVWHRGILVQISSGPILRKYIFGELV